jgi:hypothetical protein
MFGRHLIRYGVLAVLAAVFGWVLTRPTLSPHVSSNSGDSGDYVNSPIGGGSKVSLTTAEAEMPFPILLPDASQANGSNLTEVWSEPAPRGGPEVGLVYTDGQGDELVVDLYPAFMTSPKSQYEALAEQGNELNGPGNEWVTTVLGEPALVAEPNTDDTGGNPGWVTFEINGVDANVYSHDYPTATLIDVAGTLASVTAATG